MSDCQINRLSRWRVSPDGGTSFLETEDVLVDATMSGSADEVECTTHASTGGRSFAPSLREDSLDIMCNYDEASPAIVMLTNMIFPSVLKFPSVFLLSEKDDNLFFEAASHITDYSFGGSRDDVAEFSITVRLSDVATGVQFPTGHAADI